MWSARRCNSVFGNMENILQQIVADKRLELETAKLKLPFSELERQLQNAERRMPVSLSGSILQSDNGIIAEFKRRSPSKGNIRKEARVEEVIPFYQQKQVAGISVLTNTKYFGGSLDDLKKARSLTNLPLLRKEFVIDSYQIVEAALAGANAILLIAACLTRQQVKEYAQLANSLNLEVLLEVHQESELDYYGEHIQILGVNNRDLTTFQTDIAHSLQLADKLPTSVVRISESGIQNAMQMQTLRDAGFQGFLIGEQMMHSF